MFENSDIRTLNHALIMWHEPIQLQHVFNNCGWTCLFLLFIIFSYNEFKIPYSLLGESVFCLKNDQYTDVSFHEVSFSSISFLFSFNLPRRFRDFVFRWQINKITFSNTCKSFLQVFWYQGCFFVLSFLVSKL